MMDFVTMGSCIRVLFMDDHIRIQMRFLGGQRENEDDATSLYRENSCSPPSSPLIEKEPPMKIVKWLCNSPTEINPLSLPILNEDHKKNLVVPDTFEDVIAFRAKINPKSLMKVRHFCSCVPIS